MPPSQHANFASALSGHAPALGTIEKKRRHLRSKEWGEVVKDRADGMTQKMLASKYECSERYIRSILQKSSKEDEPWFRKSIDEALKEFDPCDTEWDRPTSYTTNLRDSARIMSHDELKHHLIPEGSNIKKVREHIRARIVNGKLKDNFHGFFVVDNLASDQDSKDRDRLETILHQRIPKLLMKDKEYRGCLLPIFEYVQDVPLGPGAERESDDRELDKRMGDKKRLQAKLSALMEVAARRKREAEKRGNGKKNATKLKKAKREDALLTELYNLVCANYECVRKAWPEQVREGNDDPANYAIILSEADARGQGIHADSTRRGFSILTAMEREQYVVIVLNGYRAMRICDELNVDRDDVTKLFRERFEASKASPAQSGKIPESKWTTMEPRVWHFLVHKEFKARGLPKFEAVRVPIRKGASVVIDNRCLHGGGPGDGLPGFRAHAYGTVFRDGRVDSCHDALDKVYLATVNILTGDYTPVGSWGKYSGLWGCE